MPLSEDKRGLTPLHPRSLDCRSGEEWCIKLESKDKPRSKSWGVTGLTLFELLISCCIIFILIGIFAVYAGIGVKKAREEALRYELINIRMSIENYLVLKGELPRDLITLTKERLTSPGLNAKLPLNSFLKPFRVNKNNELIDPFFNKYIYDKETGGVKTSTREFQDW